MSETLAAVDAAAHKQRISAVFNNVCQDYDDPALRFFPGTADRMVTYLQPQPGWKVLDVATGTGALAAALAQAVAPGGRVTGIDLSEGMLARAEHNIKKMALNNVDLLQMDAEEPQFHADHFDAVTCSFGLFFMPDMAKALRQWSRVTRPGGSILFSSFTDNAFAPLVNCFLEDIEAAGVDLSTKGMASERLKDAAVCRELLAASGLQNIKQDVVQMGYYLRDANDWWQVMWGSAMRGLLGLLDESQRDVFRQQHLDRVSRLAGDKGLWLDVEVRLNSAQVAE
jgi:ubiquinone/menaquinone biosynthesis C-methylase UbiE